MEQTTLDAFVAEVQSGSNEAFGAIVRALEQDLTLFVAARCPDMDLVEEVVQAAFVTAFERIDSYQLGRNTLRPWLKGIARNRLLEQLRERRRHAAQVHDRLDSIVAVAALDRLEQEEDTAMPGDRLAVCLEALPKTSQRMVHERYDQGLDIGQLAQHFRRPKRAITTALYRIRQHLKRCLEAQQ